MPRLLLIFAATPCHAAYARCSPPYAIVAAITRSYDFVSIRRRYARRGLCRFLYAADAAAIAAIDCRFFRFDASLSIMLRHLFAYFFAILPLLLA